MTTKIKQKGLPLLVSGCLSAGLVIAGLSSGLIGNCLENHFVPKDRIEQTLDEKNLYNLGINMEKVGTKAIGLGCIIPLASFYSLLSSKNKCKENYK